MDITLTFTLSDRLFALLEDKLPNLGRRFERAISKELSAEMRREASIRITASPTPEPPAVETVIGEISTNPDSNPEPVKAEVTPEEARAAVTAMRKRLLGEDADSQKGTPVYKSITSVVKQLVLAISAGRATTIPNLTPEERSRFVVELDTVSLGQDGLATTPAPY